MTMTIWAALCLVLFLITFATTRERIQPVNKEKSSPKQDLQESAEEQPLESDVFDDAGALSPFCRSAAGRFYNYYHHYADPGAMFDFLQKMGLVAAADAPKAGGLLETLGYIVHGDRADLASSNSADVFNSIINMLGTGITIIVILLSPPLARKFGKKAVAVAGFALVAVCAFAFYSFGPTNTNGMVILTFIGSVVYAPTIPLIWAIYADVADYSEWKTGRRFTGMVFATHRVCA